MEADELHERVERVLARHREKSNLEIDFKRLSDLVGITFQTLPNAEVLAHPDNRSPSSNVKRKVLDKVAILEASGVDYEFDEEGDDDEFRWMSLVYDSETLTSLEQIECAKAIESGVLARAVLDGEVARPHLATDMELLTLEKQGQEAFQKMILGNLGLVLFWARRSRKIQGSSIEDRFQDGVPGLMRAIIGWDYLRGYEFSTYATWHIRQQITRQQQDHATVIRVPIRVQEDWASARKGKTVTSAEIEEYRRKVFEIWSWELFVELERDEYLLEADNCIDVVLEKMSMAEAVSTMLDKLNDADRDIIESRYGINRDQPETLDAIGVRHQVTRERIRQKEKKAVEQMEVHFWKSIHWFCESTINAADARLRQGGGICEILCSPLNLTNAELSEFFKVSRREVIQVREFLMEMCGLATQSCDPLGEEINLAIWERLIEERFPITESSEAIVSKLKS